MEKGKRLSPTVKSRNGDVAIQATHQREAQPAQLQRPGCRGHGWGEGHEQNADLRHARSPGCRLRAASPLEASVSLSDLGNNAVVSNKLSKITALIKIFKTCIY